MSYNLASFSHLGRPSGGNSSTNRWGIDVMQPSNAWLRNSLVDGSSIINWWPTKTNPQVGVQFPMKGRVQNMYDTFGNNTAKDELPMTTVGLVPAHTHGIGEPPWNRKSLLQIYYNWHLSSSVQVWILWKPDQVEKHIPLIHDCLVCQIVFPCSLFTWKILEDCRTLPCFLEDP